MIPTRYYVLDTVTHFRVFLPWAEGERLEEVMHTMNRDQHVVTVEDCAGSLITLPLDAVALLYSSTPESRRQDHTQQAEREAEAKALQPPEWMA